MGTALTSLIALFLVIGTTITAVNTVLDSGSARAVSLAVSDERLVVELETSVSLVSATASTDADSTRVDIVITNDGNRSLGSFDEWDVTVRYEQNGAPEETVVHLSYSATESDNTWTDASFWIDYDNSVVELIEPGRLNPLEEMLMRIRLNPLVQSSTTGEVTVTTPTGLTGTIFFDG